MSKNIKWTRPSGREITTNGLPETVAYAKKHGWKRAAAKPKAEAKKPAKNE